MFFQEESKNKEQKKKKKLEFMKIKVRLNNILKFEKIKYIYLFHIAHNIDKFYF